MQTPTRLATIIVAFLAALPLHAGVVSHDFLTPGDGLLTYDDVNRREWLDLTYTLGMELSAIKSQMNPGGLLEGFAFATIADVEPFALSADVNWIHAKSNAINPNLLPNSQGIPLPSSEDTLSPGAKDFIALLGEILTIQETITDLIDGTKYTITDISSFGQIAQSNIDVEPFFDGTNVSVLIGESLLEFVNGTSYKSCGGGVTSTKPNSLLPHATGETGPFWLYRNAVPEPTSIFLLTIATVTVLSTRNRRH